jgi:hypothetical protein
LFHGYVGGEAAIRSEAGKAWMVFADRMGWGRKEVARRGAARLREESGWKRKLKGT